METISTEKSFGGVQGVYRRVHRLVGNGCEMTFAVYMPPQADDGSVPVLWYLSGLTCTHANVMEKGIPARSGRTRYCHCLPGHQPAW